MSNQLSPDIWEVVDCLNHYRLRASYGAVGEAVGCGTRRVGALLEEPGPMASWVVGKTTEMPSHPDYDAEPLLKHPHLERTDHVIRSAEELRNVIAAYRVRHLTEA